MAKTNGTNAGKAIFVERETFEMEGKTYYSYFIKGQIRGRDVKVAITPPDNGGFVVLDIVFGNAMAAELVVKPYEIKDEKTKKVVSGNTFAVVSYDENGELMFADTEMTITQRDTGEYVINCAQIIYVIDMYASPSAAHILGTDGDGFDVDIGEDEGFFDSFFGGTLEVDDAKRFKVISNSSHLATLTGDDGTNGDESAVDVVGQGINDDVASAWTHEFVTAVDISNSVSALCLFDSALDNVLRAALTILFDSAS